jgi:signal transduction histidine kinase
MKGLIDGLLLLARADAGKLTLRPQPMDLAEVVAQSVDLLSPLAAQHGVQVETELATTELHGDPDRLGQVITNLLANAIRYNRPEGRVEIRTQTNGSECTLVVRDNGIGIPAADQPRLFDRFYRADSARTQHDDTGTGLGLSLAHEIVTAHGGTIEVESTPGIGTTVTVHVPLSFQTGPVTQTPKSEHP